MLGRAVSKGSRKVGVLQRSSSGACSPAVQLQAQPRSETSQGISAACMRASAFSTRPRNAAFAHCTFPLLALITTCWPSTSTKARPLDWEGEGVKGGPCRPCAGK